MPNSTHKDNSLHSFCSSHDSTAFSDSQQKSPRRLPQEWTTDQDRYTEEIIAKNPAARARNVIAIDHMELIESETSPDPRWDYSERAARQTCDYHEGNFASPDNNLFFEERSNPLSSKGN